MSKKLNQSVLLVAVDFSPFSEEALSFAGDMAECLNAQIIVLHVIHDPADAPGFYAQKAKDKKFLQTLEEVAEEMMENFLNKMRLAHPDKVSIKDATPLLVVGTPVTRVVEAAQLKKASMIIVGSHGRSGLSHFLLGSKAERIVQLSPIAVTVVKMQTEK